MAKLFCIDHIFKHPWTTVTSAFWRKYPNPLADHVKEVDCYDRKLDAKSGMLIANRIFTCQSAVPSWLQAFGVPQYMFAAETTIVDPITKKMIIKSRNITGSYMLVVEETCIYSQHPENKEWTSYKQEAKISAFLPVLRSRLENHSIASFNEKSQLGLQAVEKLSQMIHVEGSQAIHSLMDNFTVFADNVSASAASAVAIADSVSARAASVASAASASASSFADSVSVSASSVASVASASAVSLADSLVRVGPSSSNSRTRSRAGSRPLYYYDSFIPSAEDFI